MELEKLKKGRWFWRNIEDRPSAHSIYPIPHVELGNQARSTLHRNDPFPSFKAPPSTSINKRPITLANINRACAAAFKKVGAQLQEKMKLVWSPEIASKAYIDTVKTCELFQESGVAELVSAMAAGWNAQLIVETWSQGGLIATSVGLAIASRHSCGRHVCLVPDEQSRSEYVAAMGEAGMSTEVIVGEAEDVMNGLSGVDFLVVDCRRRDFQRVFRLAKLGHRGAVLVCKNANSTSNSSFKWRSVLDPGSRLVRTVFLPVGKGLDIAHVATSGGSSGSSQGASRWIRHVDQQSGEEYVIRK